MSRLPQKNLSASLFAVRFDPSPRPINCTTFTATALIAQDHRHPLNIPISRRIDSSNPDKLYWAIRTPIALSKKRTVRSWLMRRFRDAIIHQLAHTGFDSSGQPASAFKHKRPLRGALTVTLLRPALTASIHDVRNACQTILQRHVFARQRP